MKSLFSWKQLTKLIVTAMFFSITGCGGGSSTANPNSVTGKWTVTLYNSNNVAAYVFSTTLNQEIVSPTTTSPITGAGFELTTTDPAKACFNATSTAQQTGIYTVNDSFNGLMANTAQLTIQGSPGTISLKGSFTTSGISGPWSLVTTGTGCDLSGTFLMVRAQ